MKTAYSYSAREHRLLPLIKEVGSNFEVWKKDAGTTYVGDPVKEGNYPRAALGAFMLSVSAIGELPDYVIAGIVDQKLEAPPNVPFGRTRRDIGTLLRDAVSLRPLKTLADAARLMFTDVPIDTIDTLGGFKHTGRLGKIYDETRAHVSNLSLSV